MPFVGGGQFSMAEFLPNAPQLTLEEGQLRELAGRDPILGLLAQEVQDLREFCAKLVANLYEYDEMVNTWGGLASQGFTSAYDGTNTQNAEDKAQLHFANGTYATVEYVTGTLTWKVDIAAEGAAANVNAGTTRISAGKIVLEDTTVRAAGDAPPSHLAGLLWYVTDTAGEPTYVKGRIYRSTGAAWELYEDALYNTTITAGQIVLTSISGDLDDLADGTTYGRVDKTDLAAGRISITSTAISDVAANSDNTATAFGSLDLGDLDGGQDSKLNGIAAGATVGATWGSDLASIPARFGDSPSASGLYLTSSYLGYYDSAGPTWKAYISNAGVCYFGDGTNPGNDSGEYFYFGGSTIKVRATTGYIGSGNNYFNISTGALHLEKSGEATTKIEATNGYVAAWETYAAASYVSSFIGKGWKSGSVETDGGFFRRIFVCGFDGANLPTAAGDAAENLILEINADNTSSPALQRFKLDVYHSGVAGDKAVIYAANNNSDHYIEHFDLKDCDLDSDCILTGCNLEGCVVGTTTSTTNGGIYYDVGTPPNFKGYVGGAPHGILSSDLGGGGSEAPDDSVDFADYQASYYYLNVRIGRQTYKLLHAGTV